MSGDTFTRDKFRWLDQVLDDPRVSRGAFALAYVLASQYLNRKKGFAFPYQTDLALRLKVKERQLRNLISELVVNGHLEVKRIGKKLSNEYKPIVSDRQKIADQNGSDRQFSDQVTGNCVAAPYQPSEQPIDKGRHSAAPLNLRTQSSRFVDRKNPSSTISQGNGTRLEGAPTVDKSEPVKTLETYEPSDHDDIPF